MNSITLEQALAMAQFSFAEGVRCNVPKMSVVIIDQGGNIKLAMRSDEQGIFGVDTARGKAVSALGFNRSSLDLSKIFTDPAGVAGITAATGGKFVPLGGGVVICNDNGDIIGAGGISGGLPDVDDQIMRAAIAHVGLSALN